MRMQPLSRFAFPGQEQATIDDAPHLLCLVANIKDHLDRVDIFSRTQERDGR